MPDHALKLSADHEIDALELAWARERHADRYDWFEIGGMSGRSREEWQAAHKSGVTAPTPPEVAAERLDLIRQCLFIGFSTKDTARICRAPRQWCADKGRQIMEQVYG